MNPNILTSVLLAVGKDSYALDNKDLCNVLRDIQKGDKEVKWFVPSQDDVIFPTYSLYLKSSLRQKHLKEEQALDRAVSNEKREIAQETQALENEAYRLLIKGGFPSDVAAYLCKDTKAMAIFRAHVLKEKEKNEKN